MMRLPVSLVDDEPASKMKFPEGDWITIDWPAPTLRTEIVRLFGYVLWYLINANEKIVMMVSDVIIIFLGLGLTSQ